MTLECDTLLIDRYRIVEVLAQGGMGSVYRAVDEHIGIQVAVKENQFASDGYARQFRREAMILAALRHPNLPRVTDQFFLEAQGQYLVMDYIQGEDMRERLERMGVLPEEEVIAIGAAICDALNYLNTRQPPIVHRDIKPGNVKITPQGHIFLVDFGLAKIFQDSQVTTTGARAMTPGYSPPEQYGAAPTDHRSDIFSLGATLYAALTGAIPEDALSRVLEQVELTPIRKHNPDISRRLAAAVEKSLAIDSKNRYQNAGVFQRALLSSSTGMRIKKDLFVVAPSPGLLSDTASIREAESQEGIEESQGSEELVETRAPISGSVSLPSRKPGFRLSLDKKIQWKKIVALAMLVIIVVAGSVIFWNNLNSRMYFTAGSQRTATLGLEEVATEPNSFSSAQAAITASPTAVESSPEPTKSTLSLTPTALLNTTPEVPESPQSGLPLFTSSPAASPMAGPTPVGGGKGLIAFASARGGNVQIYVSGIDGSEMRQVTDVPEGACQPNWSPDGGRIVFISPCEANKESYPGSAMFIIGQDGAGLIPIPTVNGGDYDPAWSPDGTKIAFTSLRDNGREVIYVYDLDKKSVTSLSEIFSRNRQPYWSSDGEQIIFISERRDVPEIWVMDSDGSNPQLFSQSRGYYNSFPSWSPDKANVLFTQLVAQGGIPRLAVASYVSDEYAEHRVTQDQLPMREARYSPDGYWIVFEGWLEDSNQNIFIMASNGVLRQQVTTDPSPDFDPVWYPSF